MSVGAILTLGYGTFSDVNHVVTLGYGTSGAIFVPPAAPTSNAGTGARPKPWTFSVKIGGEFFVFASLDEALQALALAEPKEVIEARAKADAERVVRLGKRKAKPAPPKVSVGSVSAAPQPDMMLMLQKAVEKAYWNALANELAEIAEEEEDIEFIASIL